MHLDEAYQRMHRYGPEFGGDEEGNHGMTNHGPMAVEVMLRRGLDVDVTRWVDRYVGRLAELPAPSGPIKDWTRALGDYRRLPDWRVFFGAQLAERSWTDVLGTWWPRLLPGIAAGSTHGVIRVGHAVRALRGGAGSRPATSWRTASRSGPRGTFRCRALARAARCRRRWRWTGSRGWPTRPASSPTGRPG